MKRFLRRLLGVETEVVPVLVLIGGKWKLMTHEELAAMRKRWAAALAGHSLDPEVKALIEMVEYRIAMASGVMQTRKEHAGNARLVSYAAGEAAALNDLLLELLRLMNPRGEAGEG